jgi:hypothetical protein
MSLDIEKNEYRPNSIINAAIAMMVTGRLRARATIHILTVFAGGRGRLVERH